MAALLTAAQLLQRAHEKPQGQLSTGSPSSTFLSEDPFPPFGKPSSIRNKSSSVADGYLNGETSQDPFPTSSSSPSTAAESKAASLQSTRSSVVDVEDQNLFPSLGAGASSIGNNSTHGGGKGKKPMMTSSWGANGSSGASLLKKLQQKENDLSSVDPSVPVTLNATVGSGSPTSATARKAVSNLPSEREAEVSISSSGGAISRVQLPLSEIHVQRPAISGKDHHRGGFSNEREAEPTTVGELMKWLMKKHSNVTIEASTSTQVTTVIIKSKANSLTANKDVLAARKALLARLVKKVTMEIKVPAGLLSIIIGAKGRTLKQITDATGSQIQIPSGEDRAAMPTSGDDNSPEQDPLIPITIIGDSQSANEACQQILAIVNERMSKTTVKFDGGESPTSATLVPKELWTLLNGVKGAAIRTLLEKVCEPDEIDNVTVFVPKTVYESRGVSVTDGQGTEKGDDDYASSSSGKKEPVVSVSGDRELVGKVVEAIEATVAELKRTTKEVNVSVNKRQHRNLVGVNAEEILGATGCTIDLPPAEDPNENVTIRGPQASLVNAFGLVMEKANATPVETLDLTTAHRGQHDKILYAANVTRYLLAKQKLRAISESTGAQIYLPRQNVFEGGSSPPLIEIVGKNAAGVEAARKEIIAVVRALPPSRFAVVHIDNLIHRHLVGKEGRKKKAFEEKHEVELIFPPATSDRSDILLVFIGEGDVSAEAADSVKAELSTLASRAADIKSTTMKIPNHLHAAIIGSRGTTLNAILGEDRLVHVTFGAPDDGSKDAGHSNGTTTTDYVLIRGPSEEVARVEAEIGKVAEAARNEQIVNSFVAEFDVDADSLPHIIGKAGASINSLREELGVWIEIADAAAVSSLSTSSAAAASKKSASKSSSKSSLQRKITLRGRQENVEEAKKRIISQSQKIADEITLSIALPSLVERSSLIGKNGMYLKRLEEKYGVYVNMPKDDAPATIRGGQSGAAAAKKELLDLVEYEKENRHVLSFVVSAKALPRILGKAGSQINEIRDATDVSIDVNQDDSEATGTVNIVLRGKKAGTTAAKQQILAIAKEVDDEVSFQLQIPHTLHVQLIGMRGSNIRELISRAGGSSDGRGRNMVNFPRKGEEADVVTITGPAKIAEQIRAEIEKEVDALQSQKVWGTVIPQSAHASVIGKGASALQELQRRHGVKIIIPNWKEYADAGDVENVEDVQHASSDDVVKIIGPPEAVVAAAEELSQKHGKRGGILKSQVMVPAKHHATIAQGGRFMRSLPPGTRVTHSSAKVPSSVVKNRTPVQSNGSSTPRIDDDGDDGDESSIEIMSLRDNEVNLSGDVPWIVESSSQEDMERTVADITKALRQAENATHVGIVTVPRHAMPRIIGRGGSGLDRLRSFGVEVDVVGRKDANRLTMTGTAENIQAAHGVLLEMMTLRTPRQQRDSDDI